MYLITPLLLLLLFILMLCSLPPLFIHPFPSTHTLAPCFHLGVCTNGASALGAGVGAELIEALGAHVLLVLLHVFLPVQVVTAVVAVEAVGHGGGEVTPGTCGNTASDGGLARLLSSLHTLPLDASWGQCCLF